MYPFNSETKKMTVVVELEHGKKVRVYTKGASENILQDCSHTLDQNGSVVTLENGQKDQIKNGIIRDMAIKTLRTISMGYKDISYHEFIKLQHQMERTGDTFFEGEEESKEDEGSA